MAMSDTGSDNPSGDISHHTRRGGAAVFGLASKPREEARADPGFPVAGGGRVCLGYSIIRIFQIPMSVKGRSS